MNGRLCFWVLCGSLGAWADVSNIGISDPASSLFVALFFCLIFVVSGLGQLFVYLSTHWYLPLLALLVLVLLKLRGSQPSAVTGRDHLL
jgi:hypothetical protein